MKGLSPSTVALYIPFDPRSSTPFYQQIYRGVRAAILAGRVTAGQRLPSSRTLASELGISRLPVLNAYEQLLHEATWSGGSARARTSPSYRRTRSRGPRVE